MKEELNLIQIDPKNKRLGYKKADFASTKGRG